MLVGKKYGGRKKGTPNKTTKNLREDILEVHEKLGGIEGMFKWALESEANQRIFYSQILPKVLPKEIKAEVEQTVTQRFTDAQLKKMAKEVLEG